MSGREHELMLSKPAWFRPVWVDLQPEFRCPNHSQSKSTRPEFKPPLTTRTVRFAQNKLEAFRGSPELGGAMRRSDMDRTAKSSTVYLFKETDET